MMAAERRTQLTRPQRHPGRNISSVPIVRSSTPADGFGAARMTRGDRSPPASRTGRNASAAARGSHRRERPFETCTDPCRGTREAAGCGLMRGACRRNGVATRCTGAWRDFREARRSLARSWPIAARSSCGRGTPGRRRCGDPPGRDRITYATTRRRAARRSSVLEGRCHRARHTRAEWRRTPASGQHGRRSGAPFDTPGGTRPMTRPRARLRNSRFGSGCGQKCVHPLRSNLTG